MTRQRARRRHLWAIQLLAVASWACLGLLAPRLAVAQTHGAALVIGIDHYADQAKASPCTQAAQDVSDRLRRQGFTVDAAIDPPAVEVRTAIDRFAARVGGAAAGTVLGYVCAAAVIDHGRLFIMPSDVELDGAVRPETQGVVLQALLNSLAGSAGTLYADLGLPAKVATEDTVQAIGKRLPAGLHLVVEFAGRGAAALVGQNLASPTLQLDPGWTTVACAMQSLPGLAPSRSVNYLPPPGQGSAAPCATPSPSTGQQSSVALEQPPAVPSPPPPSPLETPTTPPPPPTQAPETPPVVPSPPPTSQEPAAATTPTPGSTPSVATPPLRAGNTPARQKPRNVPAHPVALPAPPSKNRGNPTEATAEAPPSSRVSRLQGALARKHFYGGPVDGRLSKATLSAIRAFQHALGNPETGTLTQAEIVRLLNF